jgi:hypothetical protein
LRWWQNYMAEVQDDPCDATLQSLCTLLDVMDGEIVRTWGADGHGDRVAVLRECRAAARQANALVAATALAAASERGQRAAAAKKAKRAAS